MGMEVLGGWEGGGAREEGNASREPRTRVRDGIPYARLGSLDLCLLTPTCARRLGRPPFSASSPPSFPLAKGPTTGRGRGDEGAVFGGYVEEGRGPVSSVELGGAQDRRNVVLVLFEAGELGRTAPLSLPSRLLLWLQGGLWPGSRGGKMGRVEGAGPEEYLRLPAPRREINGSRTSAPSSPAYSRSLCFPCSWESASRSPSLTRSPWSTLPDVLPRPLFSSRLGLAWTAAACESSASKRLALCPRASHERACHRALIALPISFLATRPQVSRISSGGPPVGQPCFVPKNRRR